MQTAPEPQTTPAMLDGPEVMPHQKNHYAGGIPKMAYTALSVWGSRVDDPFDTEMMQRPGFTVNYSAKQLDFPFPLSDMNDTAVEELSLLLQEGEVPEDRIIRLHQIQSKMFPRSRAVVKFTAHSGGTIASATTACLNHPPGAPVVMSVTPPEARVEMNTRDCVKGEWDRPAITLGGSAEGLTSIRRRNIFADDPRAFPLASTKVLRDLFYIPADSKLVQSPQIELVSLFSAELPFVSLLADGSYDANAGSWLLVGGKVAQSMPWVKLELKTCSLAPETPSLRFSPDSRAFCSAINTFQRIGLAGLSHDALRKSDLIIPAQHAATSTVIVVCMFLAGCRILGSWSNRGNFVPSCSLVHIGSAGNLKHLRASDLSRLVHVSTVDTSAQVHSDISGCGECLPAGVSRSTVSLPLGRSVVIVRILFGIPAHQMIAAGQPLENWMPLQDKCWVPSWLCHPVVDDDDSMP